MAQKVVGLIKLQIPAGKATPAPPVGPALGQHGVNIMAFTKEFNERTKNDMGLIIYHQDSARRRPHQEGLRYRERFRCSQQDQGRNDHVRAGSQDRRAEDARPQCSKH